MITVSKEDYLKAVLEAESGGKAVISATLAHRLSVSAPAVTTALRRLEKDGLVRVRKGRVELTTAGRQIAGTVSRRHHLIERMLSEIFHMEWYKVHDEAERLEHAVSADFEAKLTEKLGRSGICPHGNRAPSETPAARKRRGLILLSEAETGRVYVIGRVYERDRKLLEFLDERGIQPGSKVELEHRNYDQTLSLITDRGRYSVGKQAAERVWVALASRKKGRARDSSVFTKAGERLSGASAKIR
jgi:DtxR family transcriptional regulator, Mn-dependent transcriptional regulator